MKTLGIELVDSGFEVAVGRATEPGGPAVVERLASPGTVPALAMEESGTLHFGMQAERRRFLLPRRICESFWEDLSLQPSNLRQGGRALSYSEIGFHFLNHIANGLPGVAAGHESLVLAVPPFLLEATPHAEEQVGILLGICGDLELKVSALADSASLALLDPESGAPTRGLSLVIDLHLHAAQISVLEVGQTVSRRAGKRLPGLGWLGLVETARRALAARFLRQTSFDITADRHTEQEFHDRTLEALETFTTQPEAWMRITFAARERAVSVPRDALAAELKGMADTIAQAAQELARTGGRDLAGTQVYLTSRSRQLAGLMSALRARGAMTVQELGAGAAARGAALLARTRTSPADLGDVPIENSLTIPHSHSDPSSAIRAAFAIHRIGNRRSVAPTHVVIDGIARPLRKGGLRIGTSGNGHGADVSVAVVPTGLGPCEMLVESSAQGWTASVAFHDGSRLPLPGGDVPLAPGDLLEIHGTPGTARVLFVRVEE